ncbi:hypothetical protein A5702_15255 [Mycobacterium sp. E3339]|nr:hypothetical protein A5702_15255 [Mycobacterium sp. E3339]
MYCSSACRQKAHRGRSARRTAALRETVRRDAASRRGQTSEVARSLQRSAASSMQRARQQVDRSVELCRTSELRLQESDAIRRAVLQMSPSNSSAERALWPGN